MEFDIIVVILMLIGIGGIGIVRILGKDVFDIVEKFIRSRKYKSIKDIFVRYVVFVDVYDGDEFVDEVILIKFKFLYLYIGEDIVEI